MKGLKVPAKPPKRGGLWLNDGSCIRLRPERPNLFNNNDDQHNRTELMVLITPHVVDNPEKARVITNELRKKLPEVQPLFDERG